MNGVCVTPLTPPSSYAPDCARQIFGALKTPKKNPHPSGFQFVRADVLNVV